MGSKLETPRKHPLRLAGKREPQMVRIKLLIRNQESLDQTSISWTHGWLGSTKLEWRLKFNHVGVLRVLPTCKGSERPVPIPT